MLKSDAPRTIGPKIIYIVKQQLLTLFISISQSQTNNRSHPYSISMKYEKCYIKAIYLFLGCVVMVGVLSGISYFIYRNRGFNRPQVLNDRCSNPDSSGYIDDASVRVSMCFFCFVSCMVTIYFCM